MTLDAPERLTEAFPGIFRAVAGALLILLILPLATHATAHAAGRTYHPEALAWVAAQPTGSPKVPTHLRVEGEVAYVHREPDGDIHVRLCHNGRCMVAECVPGMPVSVVETIAGLPTSTVLVSPASCIDLRVGNHLAVWGISRYDGAPGHGELVEGGGRGGGHWEIHPVEGIEILP